MEHVAHCAIQTTFSTMPPDGEPIVCSYPICYRSLLPPAPSGTHWLKNTTYEINIVWDSFSRFKAFSLADIATRIRMRVIACKYPLAVKSSLQFLEEHNAAMLTPGMKDSNRFDRVPVVSSWGDEFYALDFSPAIERLDYNKHNQVTAKVLFVMPRNHFPGGLVMKGLAFVLKDEAGGYWLRATLGRKEWEGHALHHTSTYSMH